MVKEIITEIKSYKAKDGTVFAKKKDAEEYERGCADFKMTKRQYDEIMDGLKTLQERIESLEKDMIKVKLDPWRDVRINKDGLPNALPPYQQPFNPVIPEIYGDTKC